MTQQQDSGKDPKEKKVKKLSIKLKSKKKDVQSAEEVSLDSLGLNKLYENNNII